MPVACTNCGHEHNDWVPLTRLNEVLQQKNAAEQAAEAAEELKEQLEELQANGARWELEREIMRAGITDAEGIQFALMAWDLIAEDSRPEGGIAAWLAAREALPRAVQAYLQTEAAAAAVEQVAEVAAAAVETVAEVAAEVVPNSASGMDPAGATAAVGVFTREEIAAMSDEEYARNREAIEAQLRAERGR